MFVFVLYYFAILPHFSSLRIRRHWLKFLNLKFLFSCWYDQCGSLLLFHVFGGFGGVVFTDLDLLGFLLLPPPPFRLPCLCHRIIWCS